MSNWQLCQSFSHNDMRSCNTGLCLQVSLSVNHQNLYAKFVLKEKLFGKYNSEKGKQGEFSALCCIFWATKHGINPFKTVILGWTRMLGILSVWGTGYINWYKIWVEFTLSSISSVSVIDSENSIPNHPQTQGQVRWEAEQSNKTNHVSSRWQPAKAYLFILSWHLMDIWASRLSEHKDIRIEP